MGAFQFITFIDRFYDENVTPKFGDLERINLAIPDILPFAT